MQSPPLPQRTQPLAPSHQLNLKSACDLTPWAGKQVARPRTKTQQIIVVRHQRNRQVPDLGLPRPNLPLICHQRQLVLQRVQKVSMISRQQQVVLQRVQKLPLNILQPQTVLQRLAQMQSAQVQTPLLFLVLFQKKLFGWNQTPKQKQSPPELEEVMSQPNLMPIKLT